MPSRDFRFMILILKFLILNFSFLLSISHFSIVFLENGQSVLVVVKAEKLGIFDSSLSLTFRSVSKSHWFQPSTYS